MKILLIEPVYRGFRLQWAEGWKQHSRHDITILTLPDNSLDLPWRGTATVLAHQFFNLSNQQFDALVATDTVDINTFIYLTSSLTSHLPLLVYFHENQFLPAHSFTLDHILSPNDLDIAFIHYSAFVAADAVWFNSLYHRNSFFNSLRNLMRFFPVELPDESIFQTDKKTQVVPPGLLLHRWNKYKPVVEEKYPRCLILWNHPWENKQNPENFFESLILLHDRGIDFRLAVLGAPCYNTPDIFSKAKETLSEKIVYWGSVSNEQEYAKWLWKSDLLPVTAHQDFFGASVVEAMYCNTVPLLPKRLAYPEHIPTPYHNTFFYQENNFLVKLQKRIMDVKYIRAMNTQQWVQKYDWKNIVEWYDSGMEKLCHQKK
jgi:glycosyltransferase involved in cell wall biosynthesis